jgi:hypothetical protein
LSYLVIAYSYFDPVLASKYATAFPKPAQGKLNVDELENFKGLEVSKG